MSISIHHDGKTEEIVLENLPSFGTSAQVSDLEQRMKSVENALGNSGISDTLDGGTY